MIKHRNEVGHIWKGTKSANYNHPFQIQSIINNYYSLIIHPTQHKGFKGLKFDTICIQQQSTTKSYPINWDWYVINNKKKKDGTGQVNVFVEFKPASIIEISYSDSCQVHIKIRLKNNILILMFYNIKLTIYV
jgi:hypothetical protein